MWYPAKAAQHRPFWGLADCSGRRGRRTGEGSRRPGVVAGGLEKKREHVCGRFWEVELMGFVGGLNKQHEGRN